MDMVISRVLCLISLGLLYRPVGALHCVVCLPGEDNGAVAEEIKEAFSGDALATCGSVAPQNEDELVKKCPDGSMGCQTQKTGSWTAKTCSTVPADDCQIANGVQYCYCLSDRCNMEHPVPPASTPRVQTTLQSSSQPAVIKIYEVTTMEPVEKHPVSPTSATASAETHTELLITTVVILHILTQYTSF